MLVLKFGGSSVASAEAIRKVLAVVQARPAGAVVVVSAMGGVTDALIATAQAAAAQADTYRATVRQLEERHLAAVKDLLPIQTQSQCLSQIKQLLNELEDLLEGVFRLSELSPRTRDRIIGFGELLSSKIVAHFFAAEGLPAHWLDAREVILTDSSFGAAVVDLPTTYQRIETKIAQHPEAVWVAPGFIAANAEGKPTTLGRGGSDYTAALFAAGLKAAALEIWTDVNGILTADPRWVHTARPLQRVSYQEAMEMAHFGAKVIYPPTILPVMQVGIPVWVKNTFEPEAPGTLITKEGGQTDTLISGISSMSGIALLTLEGSGMIGVPGIAGKLFTALAEEGVNVILITQSSSEHSVCLAIKETDVPVAKAAINTRFALEIERHQVEPVLAENGLCILALVGDGMRQHPGISGKMFSTLGRNGVNVRAIAQGASERNISVVIKKDDVHKALRLLHSSFFEFEYKPLHVFIAGVGNVGSRLLAQLQKQAAFLKSQLHIDLKVVGLANSRQACLNLEGIDLGNWKPILTSAPASTIEAYVQQIQALNLPNSVFVDITASLAVADVYDTLLARSISVIACNKIAASSSQANYQRLKSLAQEYNTHFLYETNVGAGLPVISTLADLLRSGDQINRIEAVLSGTLNFVFNGYDGSRPFAEVVRQAQAEGYTEPDPRQDLGGTDVMRKILILAREAGASLEMEGITNNKFLPESCFAGSVEDFYAEMRVQEPHFKALYEQAASQGRKLKFVASYDGQKAQVGLQAVAADSNLFHLYGKDNILLFYSQRYPEQPLVIKGAGAGAEVTASGVFADIMRAVR